MNKYLMLGMAALPLAASCSGVDEKPQSRPNVIFILADDLGYGDLSCMGQTHFSTPNIDRLADQGLLFTQHYAGAPVSAPSRSCFITGLSTGHTPIRGNKELITEGQHPMPEDTYHIFKYLKANGYETGVFGKWGLGAPGTYGAPEKQAVDEFFGYNCQRMAHNYYPHHLWENGEKVILEGNQGHQEGQYAPDLIHEKALAFIEDNKDQPFFMWYTSVIPHAELRLPQEYIDEYKGQPEMEPEISYKGCDDGLDYKMGGYGSQETAHAAFAAMITVLDRQVGEISAKLEELGIADNTILVFTSDNGPHREGGADPDFFNSNGELRGYKRDVYEGGIRIPFIIKWPGVIEAGTRTDHISTFWDFFPTVADILDKPLKQTDGLSYLPTLTGEGKQLEHDYLYWEFHELGGRQAVRMGDWKLVMNNLKKGGQVEVYNLQDDLAEEKNIAADHPEMVERFYEIVKEARTASPVFNFEHSYVTLTERNAAAKKSESEK